MITTEQTWDIGDCLDLMGTYPDNYFDLILTDPPYGIDEANGKNIKRSSKLGFGCKGKVHTGKFVEGIDYGVSSWDSKRVTKNYFDEMIRVSKNQIIFGGNYYIDYLYPTPCWIVWDKDNGECDFADCELAWTSFKTAVRLHKYRWSGMLQGNMKKKEKRIHPTQKPLPLFRWIIERYSKEGDLICDPFLGSGTTLEACRLTNRNCVGFEISDKWEKYYPNRILAHNKKISEWF